MNEDTKLLSLAKVADRQFLVDVEGREFRDFDNPDAVIKMHSLAGRELLGHMKGSGWNSMGISTGRQKDLVV